MDVLNAVAVGVIQGVVEWLPVSSEAVVSLFFTQVLGKSPETALNASIFLHLGTMLSALVYFREDYLGLFKKFKSPQNAFKDKEGSVALFLLISTFITGILGGGIYFLGLKATVTSPDLFYMLMAGALGLTGLLRLYSSSSNRRIKSVNSTDSFIAGLLQGLAVVPGISRSGSTSFGFLYLGFDADSAFRLSFLMSVPAVLAGTIGLELFTGASFRPEYLLSTATASLVGYLSIDAVLKIADRAEIAWICFALSVIAILPVVV